MADSAIGRVDARGRFHCADCEGASRCVHVALAGDIEVFPGHVFRDGSSRCVDCGQWADSVTDPKPGPSLGDGAAEAREAGR